MILKTTQASKYIGVSINTIKTLSNRLKLKSFRTAGGHRRFRQEDLDIYTGKVTEVPEKLTVIYARCSTHKQKEISIEDMQKIVDANEKLVKELKDAIHGK